MNYFLSKRLLTSGPGILRCYEVLGINSDSSEHQIKEAFYKKSIECHPDKNPNDEDAALKFQELNEAHQILLKHKREPGGSNFDFTNQWTNKSDRFRTIKYTSQKNTGSFNPNINHGNQKNVHEYKKTSSGFSYGRESNHRKRDAWSETSYRSMIKDDHIKLMKKRRRERLQKEKKEAEENDGCIIM